jgi:hypothetical protein
VQRQLPLFQLDSRQSGDELDWNQPFVDRVGREAQTLHRFGAKKRLVCLITKHNDTHSLLVADANRCLADLIFELSRPRA